MYVVPPGGADDASGDRARQRYSNVASFIVACLANRFDGFGFRFAEPDGISDEVEPGDTRADVDIARSPSHPRSGGDRRAAEQGAAAPDCLAGG